MVPVVTADSAKNLNLEPAVATDMKKQESVIVDMGSSAATESSQAQKRGSSSSICDIVTLRFWGIVLARQSWFTFLFGLALFGATEGMKYGVPVSSGYNIYIYQQSAAMQAANAASGPLVVPDIFMAQDRPSAISSEAACVVPLVLLLANLFIFELWVVCRENGRSLAVAVITIIHFMLDAATCLFFAKFFRQLASILVGEPRPDMYESCGLAAATDAANMDALIAACRDAQPSTFASFFSGHAANSMSVGLYWSLYVLYTAYFRRADKPIVAPGEYSTLRGVGRDFVNMLILILSLGGLSWAVSCGLLRITENAHHPWDVVSGWVIGALAALMFFPRAARNQQYATVDLVQARPQDGNEQSSTSCPSTKAASESA